MNLGLEPDQGVSYGEIEEYLVEGYTEGFCIIFRTESNQENLEDKSWPIYIKSKIEALEKIKIIGDSPVNENQCRS